MGLREFQDLFDSMSAMVKWHLLLSLMNFGTDQCY